ncbi:Zinc uptake regulation protein [Legionella massiliensis]|uniref:Zinc uptake regulation protein n=1 Tax=Legionella massiliensis TaxID=1034943 RepID=A0A078KVG7_9GAMM|nr:Fur family transcriptional regulator [Legionella massiliensis]CDZ75769.1 Zinc uptake regulation protein [Legionella massiliensis]CEE11507.1 Zinc uptake regulation protein [Legionella massiliensis]
MELKLTSLRKSVLFILWSAEKPLKAYELLDRLLQIKQNAKPPTVYRVLDYFVEFGVVHKVESIQSYTLCREPEKQYSFEILMVCNECHQVNELYDGGLHTLVQKISQEHHFHLGQGAVELKGVCDKCCTVHRSENN